MKHIRWINRLIGRNWKSMASFAILYKLLTSAIIYPAFFFVFNQALSLAGLKYLTAENLSRFLHNPVPFIMLGLLAMLAVVFELFEIIGIIYIFDQCRHGHTVLVWQAILFALRNMGRVFAPRNLILIPVLLFLSPMLHLATLFNLFWSYSVSERIVRLLASRWYFLTAVILLLVVSVYAFFRWMYIVHYYALQGCNGFEALDFSTNLGKKTHSIKRLWPMFQVQTLLAVFYLLLVAFVLVVSTLVKVIFGVSGAIISTLQVVFITVTVSGFDILLMLYTFGCISELFYRGKHMILEPVPVTKYISEARNARTVKRIYVAEIIAFAFSVTIGLFYLFGILRSRFTVRAERLRTMQVTAHRGASMFYPENTMAAFEGAVEQGADWIELDVQESADGQVFVMHDTNFKRTCGPEHDLGVWEADWEQISTFDAGSFFGEEFAGEPLPLLSEVILFARETGIRLNIEIKPTGYEKHLVDEVVRLIEEENFIDQCVITSQSYDAVSQVKLRNEEIYTVYVTGLAYGAINRLRSADAFSIKSTSITRDLVRRLHSRGLEVYAWTVDSRHNINRMIDFGVDNIITNNIPLAIECINDSRTGTWLTELRKMVAELVGSFL